MIFLKNFFVSSSPAVDFIPIHHDVALSIRESGCNNGLATIHLPESGALLWITTEAPTETLQKIWQKEKRLTPTFLSLPFQKKELLLGPKQHIYLVDTTDLSKRREFYVQVMGEGEQQEAGRAQQRTAQGGRRR